ncbi:hypothetical protein CDEST_14010 [Colletotrichum destructivum]|uniref:Uncharacterized protein n=1 Tax=Colletotrichum destructivum TaxID=34406 RepID=A0AAX4J0L7_9PEZI|nr:hypothetical protein CDEST_14010 [Colletotrichum destructivum]
MPCLNNKQTSLALANSPKLQVPWIVSSNQGSERRQPENPPGAFTVNHSTPKQQKLPVITFWCRGNESTFNLILVCVPTGQPKGPWHESAYFTTLCGKSPSSRNAENSVLIELCARCRGYQTTTRVQTSSARLPPVCFSHDVIRRDGLCARGPRRLAHVRRLADANHHLDAKCKSNPARAVRSMSFTQPKGQGCRRASSSPSSFPTSHQICLKLCPA